MWGLKLGHMPPFFKPHVFLGEFVLLSNFSMDKHYLHEKFSRLQTVTTVFVIIAAMNDKRIQNLR